MGFTQELETKAVKCAQEAVDLDKQGKSASAARAYKKAVELLLNIVQFQPNYTLNKIYIQRAEIYRNRIQALGNYDLKEYLVEKEDGKEDDFGDSILRKSLGVKWENVVGLEDAKRAIKEAIIYPSKRPDLFPLGWPKGILLFGPPGCGKTLLAAAVATEIDANFISVDAAMIMSKWLGEAERNISKIFGLARRSSKEVPSIIFIDELDSLMGIHSNEVGGEARMRNQLLKEMDGIIDKNNPLPVYVIGATNKPWNLDLPFIRRFQKRIYVPSPNNSERLKMLRQFTESLKLSSNVSLRKLVEMTNGFSGSDILGACQSVQLRVNSEFFESEDLNSDAIPRNILMRDFREIVGNRRSSVSPKTLKLYEQWYSSFKAL